jgi:hypothetical protein
MAAISWPKIMASQYCSLMAAVSAWRWQKMTEENNIS